MGANAVSRLRTQRDVVRMFAGHWLVARPRPTVTDTLEFPDTEEVTGSNSVRPTFFENLSRGVSQKRLRHLLHQPRLPRPPEAPLHTKRRHGDLIESLDRAL
jgi:hypothetical protein